MDQKLRKMQEERENRVGLPNPGFADEREIWVNQGAGQVTIGRLDPRGYEEAVDLRSGQTVTLTTQDRQYNQNRVVNAGQDVFTNGFLRPIKLVEGSADYEELMANPNVMSDEDLKKLFDLTGAEFDEKVNALSNPITLNHLRTLADDADARASQIKTIETRLAVMEMAAPVVQTNSEVVEGPRALQHPDTAGSNPMSNIQRSSI